MIQEMVYYKIDKILKRTTHVQNDMRKLLHHEEQTSLSGVQGRIRMTPTMNRLTLNCAKVRREGQDVICGD